MHRLLIAPFISGQHFCEEAVDDPAVRNDNEAAFHAAALGKTGASRLGQMLDTIGPLVSPSGRFALGYTLNIPLLRYFTRGETGWTLDIAVLRNTIRTIADLDRPVVVYLSANHFTDANAELVDELASDPTNLMWGRDGPLPPDDYFNHPIVAWTLSDFDAPISRMRMRAVREACRLILELPDEAQARITAVSLLGEVHDMFPTFDQGPSQTLSPTIGTDYSPLARAGFQAWLLETFGAVKALNDHAGTRYRRFDDIAPPMRDMWSESVDSPADHIDLHACGTVSVHGWLHDREARDGHILIHLNGEMVGEAETQLNRTDVPEANDDIRNPNVGFRFDLNHADLPHGIHVVDVLYQTDDATAVHIGRRHIRVIRKPGQSTNPLPMAIDLMDICQDMASAPALAGSIDGPNDHQPLYHNPMAALWVAHRQDVVRRYFDRFVDIAVEQGIAAHLLFSHQMAPNLYGAWHGDLVRADAMQQGSAPYGQGVTLYGGTAFGPAIDRMIDRLGWTRYGVSELHPGVPLAPEQYRAMIDQHQRNGATFIAPFYMSVVPKRLLAGSDLARYQLEPDNPRSGSALFWQAIVDAMQQ
jgi:hypothetical protein